MAAQGIKVLVQVLAIVILARQLTPADFGLFAMVAAFIAVSEVFKDLGLTIATVQRQDITESQVSTLFWLNAALGVLVAAVMAAISPLLVVLYGEEALLRIMPAVALALVFTGFAAQHLALLRRQMRFATLAVIQTGAEVIAFAAAIAAAVYGFGIWALVIQRLAWSLAMVCGAWFACDWRPRGFGPLREVRGLIRFGGNVTGAMILGRLAANLDKVLLGWYSGAALLGMFERAQKLVVMPIRNLNMPLASVALPVLSRLNDEPHRYRDAYRAMAERLAMLVAPVAGLMIASSDRVIALILGDQWTEAAPILAWMGLSAMYMPVTYTLSWLYMSQGRDREMMRASIVNAVLTFVALGIGLPGGPVGVAAAYALAGIAVRVPVLFYLVSLRGPVIAADFVRIMALPATATATVAAGAYLLERTPLIARLSDLPAVAVLAASAAGFSFLIYAALPHGRRVLAETVHLSRHLIRRGAGA